MKKTMIFTAILMMVFMISCVKPDDDPKLDVALTCTVTKTDVTVNGGADGTITVNILTGTLVFNCTLSKDNSIIDDRPMGGEKLTKFIDLKAGTYKVIVIDGNNKTFTQNVTLTQPDVVHPNLTAEISSTNPMCNGGTGSITVTVKSGTPSYLYNIDGGTYQVSNIFNNVSVGTHTINVKDVYNTIPLPSVNITEPSAITFTTTVVKPSTPTASDGTITISANGGTNSYTYSVDGGTFQSLNVFTVATGTYTITVMDANGCTSDPVDVIVDAPSIYVGMEKDDDIVIIVNTDGFSGVIMKKTDEIETYTLSDAITQLNTIGYKLPTESEFRSMLNINNNNLITSKNYWINSGTGQRKYMTYTPSNTWSAVETSSSTIKYNVRAVKEF